MVIGVRGYELKVKLVWSRQEYTRVAVSPVRFAFASRVRAGGRERGR